MKVTLGAHDISIQEETQQIIPVAEAIPHPAYNPQDSSSDIMLLKVRLATPPTHLYPYPTQPPLLVPVFCLLQGLPLPFCSHLVPSLPAIFSFKVSQASRFLAELLSPASFPQLERKAKRTNAVRPLRLPRANTQVKVGNVCYLTGWGKKSLQDTKRNTLLQEAVLIIQDDQKCKRLFRRYSKTMQICAGDLKKVQAPFKVCSSI